MFSCFQGVLAVHRFLEVPPFMTCCRAAYAGMPRATGPREAPPVLQHQQLLPLLPALSL
jgi:hypothetical protein